VVSDDADFRSAIKGGKSAKEIADHPRSGRCTVCGEPRADCSLWDAEEEQPFGRGRGARVRVPTEALFLDFLDTASGTGRFG